MITQRLILIDAPAGTIGLHFTDTQLWACAGCRTTITSRDDGHLIEHENHCPEIDSVFGQARAWLRSLADQEAADG